MERAWSASEVDRHGELLPAHVGRPRQVRIYVLRGQRHYVRVGNLLRNRLVLVVNRNRKIARLRKSPQNNQLVVWIDLEIDLVIQAVEIGIFAGLTGAADACFEGDSIAVVVEVAKKIAGRKLTAGE